MIVDTAGPFQRQIERTASYRLESDPEFQAPGKRDPDTHISGRKIRKCLGLILMVVVITTLVVAMMKTYGRECLSAIFAGSMHLFCLSVLVSLTWQVSLSTLWVGADTRHQGSYF